MCTHTIHLPPSQEREFHLSQTSYRKRVKQEYLRLCQAKRSSVAARMRAELQQNRAFIVQSLTHRVGGRRRGEEGEGEGGCGTSSTAAPPPPPLGHASKVKPRLPESCEDLDLPGKLMICTCIDTVM